MSDSSDRLPVDARFSPQSNSVTRALLFSDDEPRDSRFRLTSREQARFERAIAGIDAINSADPNWIMVRGRERPRELALSELVSEWMLVLRPRASLELRIAARAHHLRRWEIPRSSFPAGTTGYSRWRTRLLHYHAEQVGIVLAGEGYPEDTILRVQAIVRKQAPGQEIEVQALEDAICLTFFETQLEYLSERTPPSKMGEIVRRTLAKMSEEAIAVARDMRLSEPARTSLLQPADS